MTAERSGFKIRLLGPVHAERDGMQLTLGSAHRQAVFAALATNPNRSLSREDLVNAVWGENPPASGMGNIYTYVSTLRRVLEPNRDRWAAGSVLTSGGGSYCLHVDEQDVDASRFEALREQSRGLRAAGDPVAELAVIREALDLWQGEALAGIPGPYAESQRERLTELHLATRERHVELMLQLGEEREALAEATGLVESHPRREHLTSLAMTAYARCGRPAEAEALYVRLRDLMIEETGTEPAAALRAVYAELLAADEETTLRQKSAFVGREVELDLLRTALSQVTAGVGSSIWIDGAAGIGKSALLREGLRGAGRMGCRVGWGVGDELGQRMPLSVFFECFETGGSVDIGDAVRDLLSSLGTGGETTASPTAALLESVHDLIEGYCAERPLVLVIDDLQWADETSLLVWHSVHQLTERLPLLLVSASRPLPASHELHLLRSYVPSTGTRMLELSALGHDDSVQLLGALGAQRADELAEQAAGNPFYLTQLATAADGRITPALLAAVTEHLAILSDDTRHALRAIAFLGDDCVVTDLPAVTGRSVPELIPAIESALESGLLIENGLSLELRHPLVRRVLHEAVPTALRVMVHREFAEKLATAGIGPQRVLAQLSAGPVPVDAWVADWLIRNAEQISIELPEQAVAVFRHATAQPNLDAEVRELLTAYLSRVLFRHGDAADVPAGWVAARTTDPRLRAEMRWMIAVVHHRRGDDREALRVIEQSLSADDVPSPWPTRFRVLISHLNPVVSAEAGRRAGAPIPRPREEIQLIDGFSVIH